MHIQEECSRISGCNIRGNQPQHSTLVIASQKRGLTSPTLLWSYYPQNHMTMYMYNCKNKPKMTLVFSLNAGCSAGLARPVVWPALWPTLRESHALKRTDNQTVLL